VAGSRSDSSNSEAIVDEAVTEADLRKQAWDFFQMQAGQRLTTFNFYIAIASLLSTGLAASFKFDVDIPLVGVVLGLFLVFFSFIFWKLDQRNRALIKGAERTLMHFEGRSGLPDVDGMPHVAKRFTFEHAETQAKRARRSWRCWRSEYSYYECFKAVFGAFAIVGLAGALLSVLRLGGRLTSCGLWL
jgi:hypothetical protein